MLSRNIVYKKPVKKEYKCQDCNIKMKAMEYKDMPICLECREKENKECKCGIKIKSKYDMCYDCFVLKRINKLKQAVNIINILESLRNISFDLATCKNWKANKKFYEENKDIIDVMEARLTDKTEYYSVAEFIENNFVIDFKNKYAHYCKDFKKDLEKADIRAFIMDDKEIEQIGPIIPSRSLSSSSVS